VTSAKVQAREGKSFSCDDAKPLHFSIEPNAVDHEGESDYKGGNGAATIHRFAYGQIHPNAPETYPEREHRREDDEYNMETLE
jgi:hypothetical protein